MFRLGEFELLVLLPVLRQAEEPYANRVREDLEESAGRGVTRGALYRTIDRLVDKGFLAWEMEPSQIPERGGHPMRRLLVPRTGRAAAREKRAVLLAVATAASAVPAWRAVSTDATGVLRRD